MLHGSLGLFAFLPETTALGLTGISPKASEVPGSCHSDCNENTSIPKDTAEFLKLKTRWEQALSFLWE